MGGRLTLINNTLDNISTYINVTIPYPLKDSKEAGQNQKESPVGR